MRVPLSHEPFLFLFLFLFSARPGWGHCGIYVLFTRFLRRLRTSPTSSWAIRYMRALFYAFN